MPEAIAAIYYSSWHYAAIHILLTIPAYRSVATISQRLRLPAGVTKDALASLAEMGLAELRDGSWRATAKDVHLEKASRFNSLNHFNWRQRAIASSIAAKPRDLHYTAVHSMSGADSEKIKEKILRLIDESRSIVGPSQEEELFALTCDFFSVE